MTLFRNGITCEDSSSKMSLIEAIFSNRGVVNVCRCANFRHDSGIQNWFKRIYPPRKFATLRGIISVVQRSSSRNMAQHVICTRSRFQCRAQRFR